ncbi:MAG: GNAT family N-acetyltransferase [Methanobrevibacter sp.]|nr:GNAT family N-acetyltransferase [Methanobrevibacter sp.]
MTINILKANNDRDLVEIANLAFDIWHECHLKYINHEQIDYMIDKFQSLEAMKNQIAHDNYAYYGVFLDKQLCGYFGIKDDNDKLFLSKLYLHKEFRGKGISSAMFEKIFQIAKSLGKKSIYLTVNKNNTHAIGVYKTKGFKIVDDDITDIGNGYVMDDYIFEYDL